MIKALEDTAGKKEINLCAKKGLPPKAKDEKKERKIAKKKFEQECKNNGSSKRKYYEEYIQKDIQLKKTIAEDQKEKVRKAANKLIKEGGVKSKYFWDIRKKLLSNNKTEYDLITEDNYTITEPE